MDLTDAPVRLAQPQDSICMWFLQRVRKEHSGDDKNCEPSEFDEFLSANWSGLTAHRQRMLISNSIELFLKLKRTERNRYTVETLIAAVDDINCCPDIDHQTLLEYACGGSGEVDLGIAKALLKAGHSLDRAAKGGISPRQALENLYASRKRHYDKCRILFMAAEHKSPRALLSPQRLRRPPPTT